MRHGLTRGADPFPVHVRLPGCPLRLHVELDDDYRLPRRGARHRVHQGIDRLVIKEAEPFAGVVVRQACWRHSLRQLLSLQVGHRAGDVHRRRWKEGTKSRQDPFWMIIGRTEVEGEQPREPLPAQVLGDEWQRRRRLQRGVQSEPVRCLLTELGVGPEHVGRAVEWVTEQRDEGRGDGPIPGRLVAASLKARHHLQQPAARE